jgi:regulation of enolase protein 1 (concanavalin A-like superfamily)
MSDSTMHHSLQNFTWMNPPLKSSWSGNDLTAVTRGATDFWHQTFYGFERHSGHFLKTRVSGDFTAEVTIAGKYEQLYDQAGLMMRIDETHWVKTGIEFTDGALHLSVVITDGSSDWSLGEWPADIADPRIRLTRHAGAIRVQSFDPRSKTWRPVRLGHLMFVDSVDVGVMCCSPEREGFEVTFKDFVVGPPISRQLHD